MTGWGRCLSKGGATELIGRVFPVRIMAQKLIGAAKELCGGKIVFSHEVRSLPNPPTSRHS
jgi:hypothetical protein